MQKSQFIALVTTIMFILSPLAIAVDTNKQLGIQGRLTKPGTAEPLQGEFAATFTIFDASAGGNSLWTETQTIRTDSKGVFQTTLGATNALNLAFDRPYWTEVKVGTETLTPRIALTSSPYSQSLQSASRIIGGIAESLIPALTSGWAGTLDASRLIGTISGALLTANSVDNTKVNFNYAGANSKGGAATDLACSGCVADSEISTIDASKVINSNFLTAVVGNKKVASGATSASDGDTINYDTTFSASPVVVCTAQYDGDGRICSIKSLTTSSFKIHLYKAGGNAENFDRTIHWIAIGS